MEKRTALIIIAVLLGLRAVMGAILPLSADEAYYLLWSQHLQGGYYDHPPAIAFLIRAGTLIFGETPLGVRAAGLLLSLPATWFVWQTAALILKEDVSPAREAHGGGDASSSACDAKGRGGNKAALAAVFFNLTLMAAVEMMAATPDMPSIVTVAAFVWAVAKAQATQDGRWWLAAGVAAGLSLVSKYSALFAGLGVLVWLLADVFARPGADAPKTKKWLKTVWPWAGGAVALLLFTPHLLWQAHHDWMTFAFQFGRVGGGGLTVRYLIEFIGAQLALASPFILALGAIGFWQARRPGDGRFLLFAILAVALLYFVQHALHDRVQGNWPCFLYPALAILAADAVGKTKRRWLVLAAAPVAAVMLLGAYVQVSLGVPLRNDPSVRLLARDFPDAARSLAESTDVVLTTDYQTTSLLRHYQPGLTVIQLGDPQRYLWARDVRPEELKGQLVYFVEKRRVRTDLLQGRFQIISGALEHGTTGAYVGYLLHGPKPGWSAKVP